jgi:prepilin-type N-terminal cleavage/methylation domain-containing protein
MDRRDDGGFTLVEIVVAMTIMGLVAAIFTTGVLQIYRTTGVNESRSIAQAQLSQALLRLDREVRYASYVGATSAGRPYVEYLLASQCVQLRLADGQLQRRSWAHDSAAPRPSSWQPIASQVSSSVPFTRVGATGALAHQRLIVDLTAATGGARKHGAITFTALNTDQDTAADADPCYDAATRS